MDVIVVVSRHGSSDKVKHLGKVIVDVRDGELSIRKLSWVFPLVSRFALITWSQPSSYKGTACVQGAATVKTRRY